MTTTITGCWLGCCCCWFFYYDKLCTSVVMYARVARICNCQDKLFTQQQQQQDEEGVMRTTDGWMEDKAVSKRTAKPTARKFA